MIIFNVINRNSRRGPTDSRPIILSEDVPPHFSEDSLSKCPELMNVFHVYLKTKKLENIFLFYVDVYNYKVCYTVLLFFFFCF